jgi:CubicO group peptidase (beta-lactamase class C family)
MVRVLILASLAGCAGRTHTPSLFRRAQLELHVPALAYAVVRDGKVLDKGAVGTANLEWSTAATTDTAFPIASSTKIFTATLLLLYVQEGKIELDAPISRYLPEAPAAWAEITVRHLAAHAGGIVPEKNLARDVSAKDALPALAEQPLAYPPGTRSVYPNADFVVLQHLLEVVGGQPFPALVATRLGQPLGFRCTGYEDIVEDGLARVAEVVPRRASVYRWTEGRQRIAWFFYPPRTYSAGGIFSCVDDLARWAVAMDRGELLTPATEKLAGEPFGKGGFGVVFTTREIHGRRAIGHSGGPALADVVRFPDERLTVIVLTNQQKLAPNLAPMLAAGYLPPTPPPAGVPDEAPAVTASLRRVMASYGTGEVPADAFANGELLPTLREWGPLQLGLVGALDRVVFLGAEEGGVRRYLALHGDVWVAWRFVVDAAGKITDLDPEVR